jgi:quinol monooxygenase YgiN
MTFVVCSRLTAKTGCEAAVREAMLAMVPISRAEDGCEEYHAHQSTDNPHDLLFYERWRDEAAFRAHTETAEFAYWVVDRILPALESRDRGVYVDVLA